MQDNRDDLYLNLRDAGIGEDVIGTQKEFKDFVTNEQNTRDLYNNLRDSGIGEDIIGSEDDFYNFVAPDFSSQKDKAANTNSTQQKPFTQQEYGNLSTVAQDVAKGVGLAPQFDTQGTAQKIKEQLGGTKEKTQFVPEASNVVMATPTADALKKYPFLKADEAVPFNRETGEPFYTWVDENGKPLSQRDIDIRTAKQEITGEREYMQKAPAAPELPDVNANAVKLDGSITDFVDNQMRAKYGDNYLNELFKTSDGREVSGTDYLTELSQGLYDGLVNDVNDARIQYIDADDEQKNQIVTALADKYKGLVSRDTIESNMTDEQLQAEAKDARRRKERQQLDEAYNNAYSQRAAVMGENMAKAQEDYNNASWLDKLFGGSPVQRAYWMNQNDNRIKIADTQINLVLDAKRVLDTGKAYDDGESWSGRFVRGMRDAMKDTGLYDGGIEEMNDLRNVKFALDAYESGNATAEQKDLLDTYALLQTITGENSDALGRMYSAGQTTVQAIPFMLQMYINPIGSLGQSTAKAATQFALKQFGRSMMSKYMKRLLATSFKAGGRITGDMLAASLPAMTFGAPAIGADMYDRLIGNVKGVTDNEGNIEYSSREGQEKSKATAIAKAIGSNYLEYQSEMVGEYFKPFTNILSAGIGKATEQIGLGQINDLIANLSNKNFYRSFSDFAKRTQWQGTIGEYLEEVVNNAENALFIGDMDFSTGPNGVFNKDVNIDTFLGVAAMTGFMSSLKTADYIRTRGRIKNNLDNAYNNGLSLFGVDEWQKISDELDNIDENNAAKTVKRLVNSVDDNDMKQAIANYAAASAMNHGFNIGDFKNNIEEASDNIVNGKVPRSAIPGFDELSPDEQPNVHDDGMIHSAILYPVTENGGNAEQVFIVKGNVALNNDGSVDIKNSSDAIYYKGSDGKIHQVAPNKILAADVPVSVEDYIASKNNTSSNVSQEPSQQAVQYSVGDEVNIDVNGQSMHGEVAGTTEDGNYIVSYENEDGTMSSVRMSPEELAGYNQATDASQQMPEVPTSTNAPQSIEQPVEAQPPAQAVEPVQPVESNTEQVQPANAEGTAQVQQEQSAQQSIPTDEEGNPLYYNAPIEATINDLYDGSLNDEEIQGFIDANIQDAQKKYDSIQKKAPKIGTNKAKYLEQKREWQTNVDEAKRILDYWQSVDNYRKEQTHTTDADIQSAQAELSGDNARAEFDEYNDNGGVNNAVSVASDFIRGAKITPDSFKAETGYGTSEQQKFVGMIAKEENGGKTIDRLAEELVSYDNSELNGVTYRGDTSLAKDAILEALQAAGTRGELAQNNTAEREKYVEARMADLDAQYMEAYGMTYDEYLSYEEQIMPTIWRDYNNYDEIAFNNMYAEEIQQLLNTRENGNTTGEKQTDDRGNQVLSEQQSIEQPGSAGSAEPGTEIQAGVQSNNENAAPQEEAQQTVAQKIADAEAQTDTNPTEAQKEAGNYKKGHVTIDGYNITIEQPKGSVRRGTDANGKKWEQTMNNTYGYIRGTEGVDGDHIDIFLSDNPTEGNVYVVDQVNPDGSFDEHKVMYGFNSADEARNAYLSNYEEGWQGLGTITEVSKDEFKKWVESSHRKTKPFVEYRSVNKDGAQNEGNTLANEAHELFSDIIAQSTHNVEINDSGISETDNTLYAPIKVDGKDTSLSLYQEEPAHSSEEPVVGVSFYRDGMTYQEAADLSDAYNQYVGERVCADGSDELAINFGSIDEAVRFEEWLNDNGGVRFREAEDDSTHKQRQLEIINDTNPMLDDYHTGIRSEDDIKTMREAIEEARSEAEKYGDETWSAYPDITNEMLDEALRSGKITVYSSKPIVNGNFVTPSRMQASDYAGGGRIYSKTVNIDDVAWINTDEGQYANTDNDANGNIRFRFIGEQGAARLDAAEEAEEDGETLYREADGYNGNISVSEEEANDLFRVVDDASEIERLNSEPTVKVYRAMSLVDGKLYPPMSKKIGTGSNRVSQAPSEFGQWEVSDERPELVEKEGAHKNHIYIVKDNGKGLWVAYNPYFHTSRNPLNDQFAEAYQRPNLVTVEVEVPESELTSGYQAEGAKDPVGETKWNAGPVNRQLSGDKKRKVILSRWMRPVRIVPDSEVAQHIAELIEGEDVAIPDNTVTPSLLEELKKLGVKIVDGINKGRKKASAMMRSGNGVLSDDDLSLANDPVSKLLGKSTRTAAQRRAFAERERQRMVQRVQELTKKLHLDNVDIVTDASTLQGRRAKAKGFYSRSTGRITIVIPNHASVYDAEQTLLHEAVAHYGLRQLFGEHFDTFLDNVYNNVDPELKQRIDAMSQRHGWSTRTATEEYLASLAENTNFEDINASWWDKIKNLFLTMLHKIGFENFSGVTLSDNELRYILWRSYENLKEPGRYRSIIGEARDMSKQRDLNVGNYAVQNSSEKVADNDDIRYREVDDELPSQSRNKFRELYEEGIKGRIATLIRAYFDRMQPMKRLQEAIEKETSQPIQPEENVYLQENRAMSIANRKYEIWERSHMEPVREAVVKLMKDIRKGNFLSDVLKRTNTKRNAYNAVVQYMKSKHGLENNEYRRNMEAEAAREPFEAEIGAVEKLVKDGNISRAEADKRQAKLKEQADKAETESRAKTLNQDYSGLQGIYGKDFEQKAKDYVGAFEESFKTDDFWKTWNGATKSILDEEYNAGLISKELYDKIRGMYKYYIPLKGWAENRAEDVYTYYTTGSGDGGRMQRRKGRTSESDDPLVTLEQDADRQFNAAARNNVKRALYNLATTHKSDLLTVRRQWYQNMGTKENPDWQRVDAEIPENATPEEMEKIVSDFEKNMRELAKNGTAMRQKRPMILPYHATKRMEKEHTVRVMVNGKEYAIYVNGNPAAAQAVNGTSTPKDADNKFLENFVLRPLRWFNRTRAALLTAWNFNFIPSNLARDAQYSIQNMKAKEPATYVMRYVKNLSGGMAKMTSARLFYKDKKGTLDMNDPTERLFKEFLDNGGETGYSKTMTLEQRRRSNMSAINKLSGIDWTKGARLFFDTLAYANRSIETIVRFAAYKTSRESGRSIVQSINDAKEASVNFDKHGSGEYGNKEWRLLYIFANVKFQSMRRMLENATGHPVRFTLAQAERFALGFAVPMFAKFILDSFGDDDEKDAYDALPEWMRQSGLTIPISPIVPGVPKRTFLYLPFGPEDKVWYALGEMSYHEFNSDEPNENMAKEFASLVADLLPVDVKGYGGNMVVNLAPTAVQDIVALEQNVNYWGQPIYRETMPYNENEPGQNLAFAGTPEWFVKRAEDINRLTGGNDYSKGAFSPKPEQIEYIINQTGGGVTRVVSQIMGLVERAGEDGNKDIPALKNTPVLSSFVKQAEEKEGGKGFDREAYYKYINEYEKAIHDLKAYTKGMKKGDDEASRLAEELKKSPAGERMDTIRNNIGKIRARDKAIRKLNEIEKPTPKQEMQLEELKKESNEMKNELVDKLDDITEKRGE